MRKAVVVFLVAALSLSMLAVLAGCGDDANRDEAKRLMREGDKQVDEVMALLDELQAVQGDVTMAATAGDFEAITGEAGEAIQQEIEDILDGIDASLQAARAEYNKILALDGVEDYKEYASKMIEAVDTYVEQLSYTRELVAMLVGAITEMAETGDIDLMVLMQMLDSEEYAMIEELGRKGDELEREARGIKQDKKLES